MPQLYMLTVRGLQVKSDWAAVHDRLLDDFPQVTEVLATTMTETLLIACEGDADIDGWLAGVSDAILSRRLRAATRRSPGAPPIGEHEQSGHKARTDPSVNGHPNKREGNSMSKQDFLSAGLADAPHRVSAEHDLDAKWRRVVGRRSFLKGVGLAGVAAVPGSALFASEAMAARSAITKGDVAILRLLAAIELIESDLWQQYNELGGVNGGNPAYMAALSNLDSDMPQYIADNTDDELSHAAFLNAYLRSKGAQPVNLKRVPDVAEQQGDRGEAGRSPD